MCMEMANRMVLTEMNGKRERERELVLTCYVKKNQEKMHTNTQFVFHSGSFTIFTKTKHVNRLPIKR